MTSTPTTSAGERQVAQQRRGARWLPDDPLTRRLAPLALVNTVGNGMLYVTSSLYFTRYGGVSTQQLGVGLTLAALCGLAGSVPVGRAADRWGARKVLLVGWTIEAVGIATYTQVRSFAFFLPVVCVVVAVDRAGLVAFRTMLASALPRGAQVRSRAYVRAITNIGMGAGAALGALALQSDTRLAYSIVIGADAASFAVAGVLLAAVPTGLLRVAGAAARQRSGDGTAQRQRSALTDVPYVTVTALAALLTLQAGLLDVGLPLWVVHATTAPRSIVAVALFINTGLTAALQIPLSRGTEDVGRAAAVSRRAGVILAGSCLLYGAAERFGVALAVTLIVVGVVAHTVAETWFAAGAMALSMELAPVEAAGSYQGVFQSGFSAGLLLAPLVVTNTALRLGMTGWIMLATLFAGSGALLVPAASWAHRRQARA